MAEPIIPTPEERAFLLRFTVEHLDTLIESIHYAQQDLDQFYLKLDITHADKRAEAERVVADLKKEIADTREKLSKIKAGEAI